MYQRKREECDITSEMFRRIRRPPAGFPQAQPLFLLSKIVSPVLPATSISITCVKKTRLFKRVHNLFCFSCVKMSSALLIFPWLCCTLKPLQHVVHTPLHHFLGGHWPVESTGQCGFSWMRSLCSGAEWEGTCYFSDDELMKYSKISKNNSARTNTEITVSPYLFYKYELDTLVVASDNDG